MYGLVNNGVRKLIIDGHGEDTWRAICEKAGVQDEEFETLTAYDDATTYALVGAVSEELNLTAHEVLETFGEFWVGFAKHTAVGRLVSQGGDTFLERLRGLDEMHERIQMTMPHLDPPSFELEEMPDGQHRLHYFSPREGLAPMVVGLLHGLAEDCGVKIDVTLTESRAAGADHDVFALVIVNTAATAA